MHMMAPFGWDFQEYYVDGETVDDARNKAAQFCVDNNHDALFFLDYDVVIPPQALHILAQHFNNYPDVDVFSGVYCCKSKYPTPLIWKKQGSGVFWDWTPGDVLIDGVTCCGMGCTLIRTALFAKVEKPWFKTIRESNGVEETAKTEDAYFLEKAAAKILIDTSILCGHIDNATGLMYTLPTESLPGRRLRAQMELKNG